MARTHAKPNRAPTEFEKRVYSLCRSIPEGRVATYGEMARALGSSARAVGGALRKNPFAPVVPCHRVIASDLTLGGFSGVWQAGTPELVRKEALLRSEGVPISPSAQGVLTVAADALFQLAAPGDAHMPAAASRTIKRVREPECAPFAATAEGNEGGKVAGQGMRAQEIVGIDWSGARDAGKLIYVAHGTLSAASPAAGVAKLSPPHFVLHLRQVASAAQLNGPDGLAALSLHAATDAVVRFLLRTYRMAAERHSQLTCGVDAPLGLPAVMLHAALAADGLNAHSAAGNFPADAAGAWLQLVTRCAERWPDADALRKWSVALVDGDGEGKPGGREPKRACDIAARAPFAPTNLRLYRQTWAALALLCSPLLTSPEGCAGRVAVVPMMPVLQARAHGQAQLRLLEACPASLLKRCALYEPYKGSTPAHAAARKRLVTYARDIGFRVMATGCETRVRVQCEPSIEALLVAQASADALDAVLAAAGTACSVLRPAFPEPAEGAHASHCAEGAIYY